MVEKVADEFEEDDGPGPIVLVEAKWRQLSTLPRSRPFKVITLDGVAGRTRLQPPRGHVLVNRSHACCKCVRMYRTADGKRADFISSGPSPT
jgi:hypothetical protein